MQEKGFGHLLLFAVIGILVFVFISANTSLKNHNPILNAISKLSSNTLLVHAATSSALTISDNFNRANSTSLGNTTSGQPWILAKGNWGISNNQAYSVDGCPAPGYAVVDAASSDVDMQIAIPVNQQDVRLPFRFVDLNNLYWLEHKGGDFYELDKMVNGTLSVIGSSQNIVAKNGDIIKISLKGNLINIYLNNSSTPMISVTDSGPLGTKYGFGTWCNAAVRFDDLSIGPSTVSSHPVTTTNTSYSLGVLVLKYFPLTRNGQNIDIRVTGDVGGSYTSVRQNTVNITNNLLQDIPKATSYLKYSNSAAVPSIKLNVVKTTEYKKAVPYDSTTRRPLYNKILTDNNVCNYVNNQNVREVWIWAYQGPNNPAFGGNAYLNISESKMSGPFGDISNSPRLNDMPNCGKTYRVYTFNYGRGTSEAMESWSHQIESELDAVDAQGVLRSKFQGPNYPQTLGVTGRCGSVHNPPNARFEYDRSNSVPQTSDCLDWNPDSLGATTAISCNNWNPGCVDVSDSQNNSLNYEIWNWQNLPGNGNTKSYQGLSFRNWWDVHGNFDEVMGFNRKLTLD